MLFGTYRNPLLFPCCRSEESTDEEKISDEEKITDEEKIADEEKITVDA